MKLREKHIERLAKGKRSGINIGSRAVPHHLHQYEQKKFSAAIKRRFLIINDRIRPNLLNIWEKYCTARQWPFLVLLRKRDGSAVVMQTRTETSFRDAKKAQQFIETLL
ncbi:MAG: hypothetical protein AAGI44_11380 [Pseudomonadota bacterium]